MKCIIPHYGDNAVLERCIASLPEHLQLIVVNSNISGQFFTETINSVLQDTCDLEHVWILNNDTVVDEQCYFQLCEALDHHPEAGIIGCQSRMLSNPDHIFWGGSGECFPAGQHKQGLVSMGQLQEPTYEQWITFASVLIRKEVFRDIGILDRHFRHICSDADYCLRARDAGWQCLYWPKAIVLHDVGTSARPKDDRVMRVMREDQIMFQRKWINTKRYHDLMTEVMEEVKTNGSGKG